MPKNSAPPQTPALPQTLDGGRYRIEGVIGNGGSAIVLLAVDTRMGVHRAIKLMLPEIAASAQRRSRLKAEAQAQAGLKHPNVLMVHDAVEDRQGVYLVMELAEADSLSERLYKEGPLSPREVVEVGIAIGGALGVAHDEGMVHRDIKPGNILVDRHGVYKLADFGIAHAKGRQGLTHHGMVMGTLSFMPPEQRADSSNADPRSDTYAFGVTLYALLVGEESSSLHNQEAWPEAFAKVPPLLAPIIQRATRFNPEDRYPRVQDMVADLQRVREVMEQRGERLPAFRPPPLRPLVQPTFVSPAASVPPALPPPARPKLPWVLGFLAVTVVFWAVAALIGGVLWRTVGDGELPGWMPGGSVAESPVEKSPVLAGSEPGKGPPTVNASSPAAGGTGPSSGPPATPPAGGVAVNPAVAPRSAETASSKPASGADQRPKATSKLPADLSAPADPKPPAGGEKPSTGPIIILAPDSPAPKVGESKVTAGTPAAADQPTGTVTVRTVPSGATVQLAGKTLRPGPNGGYVLPAGSHSLTLVSPSGEKEPRAVFVRAGESVALCYNFDTNSSCSGSP